MTLAHAKGTFAKETPAQTQAWEGDPSSDEGYVTKCHQISLKFLQISCNISPSSREGNTLTIAHAKGTFAKETLVDKEACEGDHNSDEG